MIFVKIILDLICGALNAAGGFHWLFCRRYIMPVVIAVGISLATHTWWLGLLSLPVMGTLCLKYFGGTFWGHGGWLATQAAVIGIGVLILGHLVWYFFIPYVVIAFLLGGFLYNLQQLIGDAIFGTWLGIIILLVR